MKYFIDTEFLEGPQQEKFPISLFRKQTPPTIDLISIGIVSEDGREYYAISKDFNLEEAWNRFQLEQQSGDMRNIFPEGRKIYWLRENVLKPIFDELYQKELDLYEKGIQLRVSVSYPQNSKFSFTNFKKLILKHGKTNKEIALEIVDFTKPMYRNYSLEGENRFTHGSVGFGTDPLSEEDLNKYGYKYNYPPTNPELYAYYADYDWVVFCWIFGKMMDLPDGFPMYCRDLKQILDDKVNFYMPLPMRFFNGKPTSFNDALERFKNNPNYPKQDLSKSHNSIEDARFNKNLFQFLSKI